MEIFHCRCGATLFFENVRCLQCKRELGYLPEQERLSPIEPAKDAGEWIALASTEKGVTYRKCQNYAVENVCNWMLPVEEDSPFCLACRLNDTIPNLAQPENRVYWAQIEAAKRRLLHTLLRLHLPLKSKREEASGLAFAFLSSAGTSGGDAVAPVMTGHADGLITLNVAEADEIEREQVRRQMGESYRTVLGHLRHESGHYYW